MTAAARTFRPRNLVIVCVGLAGAFIGGAAFLLLTVLADSPNDYSADRSAIIGLSMAVLALVIVLGRTRAVADADGLRVRNPLQKRTFAWAEIVAVRLGPHDSWVQLDLSDGTTYPVMAIQASDGSRGQAAAAELAQLVKTAEVREPRTRD